jgi:hypothetical protein
VGDVVLRRFALLVAAALVAAACAETVRTRAHPALAELAEPLRKVAVAPFTPAGRLALGPEAGGGGDPALATELVAHQLSEALGARGVQVVAPEDVGRALGSTLADAAPREIARLVAERFGVDGIVVGSVSRFVERSGEAAGTLRPASVGFEVTLLRAPGGEPLWTGLFDETQRALFENVLNATRYPGGGSRWLTAEELARWGATETARALPLGN